MKKRIEGFSRALGLALTGWVLASSSADLPAQTPTPTPATTTTSPGRWEIPATDDGLPGVGPIRRYDWFRKLWAGKRAAWSARVREDAGAVVFLGDSITQGWGDTPGGGQFEGMKVANRGISGDTTRGVLIRMNEDVLALNPTAVVLLIGTNDLEEKAEPEEATANLRLILARMKVHDPTMPIILCQVFPSSATMARPAAKIRKLNELYAAAVKGDPQVTLVETWTLFANDNGDAKPEEFPDLLHPNAAGYAKWAAAIRPILATQGWIEKEPDTFKPEPGFVSLFNGRDLTGWGYRTNAFDGRTSSPDGRYVARNGRLIVTTPPEGRRYQVLWTKHEFPTDFVLKLEFRATPNADSGVFIRSPQLQCRDYLLAGPYKKLQRYKPQDWNEMVVTVKGGVAQGTCNGEELEAALPVPATGPIGLEGDRGQMEYRRIRVQELP